MKLKNLIFCIAISAICMVMPLEKVCAQNMPTLKNGTEVHSAIRIHLDRTIYELAFTPRAVSPFKLKAGHSMRWNIIVNLNNGKGRIGYLELTDGIGGKKRPGQFMDLVLLP